MKLDRIGVLLVFFAAVVWSFAGLIARYITTSESWTIVFWRSVFSAITILVFIRLREGRAETWRQFRAMGMPGAIVALGFATASIAYVIALGRTTVANILLIQAGIPLIAALMAWATIGERIDRATWLAIFAVLVGMAIMFSDALGGRRSWTGDALALLMTTAFSATIVVMRRHPEVRMMPAVCSGTVVAALISSVMAGSLAVSLTDGILLFAFGALNLGLGTALFVSGARRIPASLAALIGTVEPMLGPIWVWLAHDEVPADMTLIGGAVVFGALLAHIVWQLTRKNHRSEISGKSDIGVSKNRG